jgi:hypothetical protein
MAGSVTHQSSADEPFGDRVERLGGHGRIRRDGVAVGESDYDLVVTPPHLRGAGVTYEAGLPSDHTKTVPEISGRLIGPLFHAQAFAEGTHTLVLEDGREFDFHVLQPDTNEIVGVSWFRFPGESGAFPANRGGP